MRYPILYFNILYIYNILKLSFLNIFFNLLLITKALFLFVFIIKTISIEVKVVPKLNNDKGLELKIKEVKFLDLKIANWIVNLGINSFIKDWFPKDEYINIDFKEGLVVIYKDNFKEIELDSLEIESTGLNINMTIDLCTIINKIN